MGDRAYVEVSIYHTSAPEKVAEVLRLYDFDPDNGYDFDGGIQYVQEEASMGILTNTFGWQPDGEAKSLLDRLIAADPTVVFEASQDAYDDLGECAIYVPELGLYLHDSASESGFVFTVDEVIGWAEGVASGALSEEDVRLATGSRHIETLSARRKA